MKQAIRLSFLFKMELTVVCSVVSVLIILCPLQGFTGNEVLAQPPQQQQSSAASAGPSDKVDGTTVATIRELETKLAQAKANIDELERMIRIAAAAKNTLAKMPQMEAGNDPKVDHIRAQSLSNVFREASKKVIPATVKVLSVVNKTPIGLKESVLPRNIPGMPTTPAMSMGTGVIIDPKGIVLTNNHVVAGSRNVDVELSDGRRFHVIDMKTDHMTDVAVLWLDSKEPLPFSGFGDSDSLDIGDWVLAIGNPFELDSTVSAGIISAKGRSLKKIERGDFLQTDASINPGNSGGPLINLDGEVIGINTAIASASGGNQGIGFAIPSNTAKWIVAQLVEKGEVIRAYLGVQTAPVNAEQAKVLGVGPRQGVVVERIFEDTPGEKGGVKRNDVILAFDGQSVSTPEELQKHVERADMEIKHKLTIVRDKKKGDITLSIAQMPVDFNESKPLFKKANNYSDDLLGVIVIELTEEIASRFEIKANSGVVIISVIPNSVGDRVGLKQGMVIEKIDDLPIQTTKDYIAARKRGPLTDGFDFIVVTPEGKKTISVKKTTKPN